MIDYKQNVAKAQRYYMYLGVDKEYYGKYLRLAELHVRSECVVSRPTLSQRLTCGIRSLDTTLWPDVMTCLTTPAIAGRPKDRMLTITEEERREEFDRDFIDLMHIMPIGSMRHKALRMQSMQVSRQISSSCDTFHL